VKELLSLAIKYIMTTDETSATTVIELSTYENDNSQRPPTVTGTVYQAVVPSRDSNGDVHDPECILGNNKMCMKLLHDIEKHLKTKAAEILACNPWLASKIIKNPNYTMRAMLMNSKNKINTSSKSNKDSNDEYGSGSGKYSIEFTTELTKEECQKRIQKVVRIVTTFSAGGANSKCPLTDSTTSKEITKSYLPSAMKIIIADPITENTYDEIVESVRPFVHASTESVVSSSSISTTDTTTTGTTTGTSSPSLWDIILIPLTDSKTSFWNYKFLLVHSIDQSLADGNTFYKIYSMLSSDRPVERLDPTRNNNNVDFDFDRIKEEKLGGEDPNFLRSAAVMAGQAKRFVRVGMGYNPSSDPNITPNQTRYVLFIILIQYIFLAF
jgi:hypothetical protein